MEGKYILWAMIAVQLIAWGWHQCKAGKLKDKHYIIFCYMMMCGQIGAGIECFLQQAWGTLAVQIYFFFFTGFGAFQRKRQMKKDPTTT